MNKWFKKVGDEFTKEESLCEITLGDYTVALDCPASGVLAEIRSSQGTSTEADEPIAMFLSNKDEYFSYIEDKRLDAHFEEMVSEIEEIETKKAHAPDTMQMLRHIKNMIRQGVIKDKGTGTSSAI